MIASLAMYDRPEIAAANDALWAGIRDRLHARGLAAPHTLTRGEPAYWPAWTAADLVLSQTCGLPFRARLHDRVTLIGTPDYAVEGCPPGWYRSVIVARKDDPRQTEAALQSARLMYNEPLSQSGWAAIWQHFQDLGLCLPGGSQSGGHRMSALAVAEGRADFAAIDAVTWRLLQRHEAFVGALHVIARTRPTPGLPLIAAQGADAATLFECVRAAIADLDPDARHTLGVQGLVKIPAQTYLALPIPPVPAQIDGTH
jgi:ABC-type phosphate/phosphonate transport system substrate-binding protein